MATTAKKVIVAVSSKMKTAMSLAALVSAATMSDMVSIMQADEDKRRSSVVIYLDLLRDMGRDKLLTVPRIDTTIDEGVNNPDGYYIKKTLANGGSKDVRAWWHNDFADSTSTGTPVTIGERPDNVGGVEIDGVLLYLSDKIADKTAMSSDIEYWKTERAYWQGRKSTNRNTYTRGLKIFQRAEDMAVCNKLSFRFKAEGKDTDVTKGDAPTTSKAQVKIWEKDATENYVLWSIGTFLQCDPNAAHQAGGLLADLVATVGDTNDAEDEELIAPLGLKDLELNCQRVSALLNQDKIGQLLKAMAAKKDTGPIFAHTFYETLLLMQAAASDAGFEKMWQDVEKEAA